MPVMMEFNQLTRKEVENKKVLLRLDLNVPLKGKEILDKTRIDVAIGSINFVLSFYPKQIIILAHLGRPKGYDESMSLAPIVRYMKEHLECSIELVSLEDAFSKMPSSKVVCIENIRFYDGEESNSPDFAKRLSQLAQIYVNDAFSVMHRKHASTYGIASYLPSYIGKNALNEIKNLDFSEPERPFVVVLGGKKLETKLALVESLVEKADKLLIGGAMAFTFLKAEGYETGKSLVEDEFLNDAKRLISKGKIILPQDFICAHSFESNESILREKGEIKADEIGLDIGAKTINLFESYLKEARLIFWNGAMGVFEKEQFASGTEGIIRAIKDSNARKIAGGGETIQAIKEFKAMNDFDFISMGGGAALDYIAYGTLPCLEILTKKD
ncbi:MAG: phosphoglycerate kinase [Candidatus Woesearchaeota archaeon]|nr:phosphoglycerate kinase [Candidatus Woesearchaeota archaeon]